MNLSFTHSEFIYYCSLINGDALTFMQIFMRFFICNFHNLTLLFPQNTQQMSNPYEDHYSCTTTAHIFLEVSSHL